MTSAVSRAQGEGFAALPGWELVGPGLADLAAGRETVEGALVALASKRLIGLGVIVPISGRAGTPQELYELIVAEVGERRAHARYNALRRRLASFLRALAAGLAAASRGAEADARNR